MKDNQTYYSLLRVLFAILSTIALPIYLLCAIFSRKHRKDLCERLGAGVWRNLNFKEEDTVVWCHGASVGEIGGAHPVFENILREKKPTAVIVSTTSHAGKSEAKKKNWCTRAALLPFDNMFLLGRVIDRVKPDLFVLVETEIWPSLLIELYLRNISVVLINARISDYSFPKYKFFRIIFAPILCTIDKIMVQTELDRQRYIALGAREDSVSVVGSTKYDKPVDKLSVDKKEKFLSELGLSSDKPCFVAGSVREGEDERVITAYIRALEKFPSLQMIIAPRQVERFTAVAELLENKGLEFTRRSKGVAEGIKPVALLDTIGELSSAYALATVSFVGGSLTDTGGHNPLEPASQSSPVVVGPYTSNVRDAVNELQKANALFVVSGEEELVKVLCRLLGDIKFRDDCGKNASKVWAANLGASKTVGRQIITYLS